MRWLVTGGEGFIGSRLLEQVDGDSWEPHNNGRPSLHGYGMVAHLGAMAGIGACLENPCGAFLMNCTDTLRLLQEAREDGWVRAAGIVFASSAAAANPTNPYAASKAAMESWCQAYRHSYGVQISILRFGNVYGPGSWRKTSCVAQMCRDALDTGVITVHGKGHQTRDFVHVDDVIAGIQKAPDGLHSLRTGRPVSVRMMAETLSGICGARVVHADHIQGGSEASHDDAPWLELDYTPLESGLRSTWEWFKAEWQSRDQEG